MLSDGFWGRFGVREKLIAAVILCAAIYYVDSLTSATFLAAALYIPVAGLFYGVQSPSVFIIFCAVCTALSAVSGVSELDEVDFLNFAINRGVVTLVLYSTCFLIYRRHFMELMAREQRRADRYNTTYSVLMIDIDHFKRVNDTYGHQVGDHAIQAMAEACKNTTRPTDIVARYGGEEFIVTLTHTDRVGALKVAERLREAVAEIALPTEQGALSFTISIGLSTYVKRSAVEQIIGRADQALYKAKETGRNRVCVEDDPAVGAAPA